MEDRYKPADNEVLFELDGPGASPNEVSSALFLRAVAAFFRLLERNAELGKARVDLRGVRIIDKCVACVSVTDNPAIAQVFAGLSLAQLAGDDDSPRGIQAYVEDAQSALRGFLPGARARVIVGSWSRDLPVLQPPVSPPIDALLSIRARLIRAGGKTPTLRFSSRFEGDFSLSTTEEVAIKYGAKLYSDFDIVAMVTRDADGAVDNGRLLEATSVEDIDPRVAWTTWADTVYGSDEEKPRGGDQ